MSTVKTGMSEHIRNFGVFLSWTLTSFFCHYCAKRYFFLSQSGMRDVLTVSACQLGLCFVFLNVSRREKTQNFLLLFTALGHVFATIATNYSLSFISAASTLAVKMLEPITSALIQRTLLGTPLDKSTVISLPIIVTGTIMFTGNPLESLTIGKGIFLALMSNVSLALRNISMKLVFHENTHLTLRFNFLSAVIGFSVLVPFSVLFLFGDKVALPLTSALTVTAVFHVVYTYFSVALVLNSVSVITHAILNIFKRVFVVLLFCFFGTKVLGLVNFLGLTLGALGLGIYVSGKTPQSKGDSKPSQQLKTKLAVLLCLTVVPLGIVDFSTRLRHPLAAAVQDPQPGLENVNTKASSAEVLASLGITNGKHEDTVLANLPFNTNINCVKQTTEQGVIDEIQKIHFEFFSKLLHQYSHVILLDVAIHDNKGDGAIGYGEYTLLRRLDKKILFECDSHQCTDSKMTQAKNAALKIGPEKVVVMSHGGGNIVGYHFHDTLRKRLFDIFHDSFKVIVFPQSIWISSETSLEYAKDMYGQYPNVTLLMRDHQSLERAKNYFPKNRLILMPDMAFQIGTVPRTTKPKFDILWHKRIDSEKTSYQIPSDSSVSVSKGDWIGIPDGPSSNISKKVKIITNNGFLFLQRGRVVVTDRLHGHILSILLHIPHVVMNPMDGKISAYHNTWTKGLEGKTVLTAHNATDAFEKAKILLKRFHSTLPKVKKR